MRTLTIAAAALLTGAAALPPPGATNCSGCHNAGSMPIVGMSTGDLSATMLAYRSGERPSTLMGRLMKGLTPAQIQDIAAWIAGQTG